MSAAGSTGLDASGAVSSSGSARMRAGTNLWNLGYGIYSNVFSISGDSSTWSALVPPFTGAKG